ncbi:MAG: hypothetical protein A2X28_02865 [Elusimicrobia bacterium GWA2_56_46]|nr:MAG: hypothetical protein A2X28_02865 [Elusimicrobia bacterium GWA2_56_46]OGR54170.1 MAG: hypothetical protein A2X39_08810 [Elusimicrobia bacterium GWC2_56_31]HBB67931.1 hypothetical protein [Elusimicrobiota bacterium]HBW21747.1 hypothetical protein [Elusimicrobiota bacterium]
MNLIKRLMMTGVVFAPALMAAAAPLFAAPSLLSPAAAAAAVSQSPALSAADLTLGASVQYHFQVDTVQTMDSQGGSPQGDFDQTSAQVFASSGAFSGQDSTITVTGDAYNSLSTATFAFYSSSARLSANTLYYWRARAKPSGGAYGAWSGTASFTTGEFAAPAPVNNIFIGNVSISSPTDSSAVITFNIRENNVSTGTSPGGGEYNTADWIFVKFSTQAGADGSWNHAALTGGSVGAGAAFTAASDNMGVFLNHTAAQSLWSSTVTLTWNYAAGGATAANSAMVKVFAVSMVRVPSGSFVYNAGGIGGSLYNNYGGGAQATVASANDIPTGAPAGWPNGYNSFYIGRYEITQGQYADFLNTVWSSTAAVLYYSGVANGHNMTNSGTYPNKYAAVDRNAAKNYLSVSDAWSYMSWAGLRPITEMEFEKAGRDINGDTRTYPWGNTAPDILTYTPPNEGGTCISKYLNYNNTAGCTKVLDVGRYMSGDMYRTAAETGASPWGIPDLAGNVWEFILNSSYASVPANGTGTVYWPGGWPVPGATNAGLRGGGWSYIASYVRVSDRYFTSWANTSRSSSFGARCARTP